MDVGRNNCKATRVAQIRNDGIDSQQQQKGCRCRAVVLKLLWISSPLKGLIKCRFLGRFDLFNRSEATGLGICISDKFLEGADIASLENHGSRETLSDLVDENQQDLVLDCLRS